MDVKLIIKSPSQKVDDHTINGNVSWTVERLKEELHENYPTRPSVQEQKLIYSGHLLHDHMQLKDFLRVEDGLPSIYTLHLVCKSQSNVFSQQTTEPTQTWHNQAQAHSSATPSNTELPESVLRHRNTPMTSFYPQFPQQVSGQPPVAPAFVTDPQVLAQMATMQQMYAYYFTQYMHSINTSGVTAASALPIPSNLQTEPISADPAPRQDMNRRVNVPDENEEHVQRDWIDHFFLCGRFLLFFCIVLFYSTPERLMIVIVCAVIAFLYHEGWFVRRGQATPPVEVNQGNRQHHEMTNNENNEYNNSNPNPAEELQNGHELEAAMDAEDPPHAETVRNNNIIFTPFTFLSSFFSSLIPEPPPPVNIN